MTTEMIPIEQNEDVIAVCKQLSNIKSQIEQLKKADESARKTLKSIMDDYGITSFKNDYVTISNVASSASTTIDLKAFEKKEPDLYKELLKDYEKVTTRSGYVKIIVK